jgi:hypothetical protein
MISTDFKGFGTGTGRRFQRVSAGRTMNVLPFIRVEDIRFAERMDSVILP